METIEATVTKSSRTYDRSKLFIIKDKVYDLTDWIDKHPGGAKWFQRSVCRDISVAIYAYHKEPHKLERILKRYETDLQPSEIANFFAKVPEFLKGEDFDETKDVLTYDWSKKDGFLKTLRSRINTASFQAKIKKADLLFDIVSVVILVSHILMMFVGVPYEILPLWGYVLFFTISRTALAAVGHYHCHRKKNGISDWGDALFDMQYVGFSIILYDGHVMGHHFYTNSRADVKRTVFTGMLELPRLFRVPVMTLQKFGQFFTGYFIRWNEVLKEEKDGYNPIKFYQLLFVRLLLLAEFIFCMAAGYWLLWALQFITTTWFNLFLIVSSHDFEEPETHADLSHGQDWGVFQVENSFDMSVVGNGYIDCFLTAGLGTHRSHHVLPDQRSGFANILSNKIVKQTWEEFGHEWARTRNFLVDRFPKLFVHYMFSPVRIAEGPPGPRPPGPPPPHAAPPPPRPKPPGPRPDNPYTLEPENPDNSTIKTTGFFAENFSRQSFKTMWHFIYVGFKGIGSI